MKSVLMLLAAFILCCSCSFTSEDAVLSIKVTDPVAEEVVVVCNNDITVLPLDGDGCATFVLKGSDMAFFRIFHGQESLLMYLEEGDNAMLSFEGHNLKRTYVFDGEKAPAVKYLNTVSLVALPDQDYALPFDEYKTRLDAKAADAVKLLKANGLSSAGDFEENEEDRIRYSYAAPLIMYPMAHRIMTGRILNSCACL